MAETATAREIRSAYLALARTFHPDRLGGVAEAERNRAAVRMARVNAAWAVLGDERRRAAYDAGNQPEFDEEGRAHIHRVEGDFRPHDDGPDWVDPRLLSDDPISTAGLPRLVTLLPAGLFAAGVAVALFGFILALVPLLVTGVVLVAASALAFLLIPLVAMINSSRSELD